MTQADLSSRRSEIVAAASRLLAEEGRAGLTMRRLADRLGIKAPSIYKHLPDKQALEHALISDGFERLAVSFATALEAVPDRDAAWVLAVAYREFAHQNPHLYQLMTEQELDRTLLKPGVEAAAAQPLVDALGGDGDLARALWGFAHGMTVLELNHRFPSGADLDTALRRGVQALAAHPDTTEGPGR